ncbi:MAG TPA: MarR family transcriptional regulator [Actinomycetales bacterium]|nr:MarR family transcriptional regulator [Actinomycetales bacterium]
MAGSTGASRVHDVESSQVDAVMDAARLLVAVVAASVLEVEDRASLPQLRVLTLMAARGFLTLGAVADALGVHPSNATRMCDRLVAAGYVDRQDDPDDRRQLRLTLTDQGAALVDSLMAHRRAAVARAMAQMPASERAQLAASLTAFTDAAFGLIDHDAAAALSWV